MPPEVYRAMISRLDPLLRSVPPARAALVAALGALGLWAYWPTLAAMSHKWFHDSQYTHGYLVPVFAVVLLWLRRAHMPGAAGAFSWWGVALLLVGGLIRLAGAYVFFDWLDAVSILPCVLGLFVLLGGRPVLRWCWPSVAFLIFMIPLPFRVETALSHPLQSLATKVSTYALQTVGLPALAEGNVIILSHGRIGVVEACSGLAMLLSFFALATAMAIVIKRPLLDRVVILLSAAPIAVAANVLRIVVTGAAHELISPQVANAFFHDWAGYLMPLPALGMMWLELWLLSRILVPAAAPAAVPPVGLPGVAPPPPLNGKARKQPRHAVPLPPPPRGR
jgi:exosortase